MLPDLAAMELTCVDHIYGRTIDLTRITQIRRANMSEQGAAISTQSPAVIMRRFLITIATAIVFVAGAPIMGASVGATPILSPGATRAAADNVNIVESVQFIWLGRDYCWYDDGWQGPGWYWCGYEFRRGLGWGGGYGWHNWSGGHSGGAAVVHGGRGGGAAIVRGSRGGSRGGGAAVSRGGRGGGRAVGRGGGGGRGAGDKKHK
jgi:hypothetical protein